MRDARYLHEGDLLADGSGAGLKLGDRSGELFLVFSIRLLGLCALPIAAVQTVCAADGPVRRVPLCGGAGSRFAGLVSVRGQVQLLFDLSASFSPSETVVPAPVLSDHLLVAVAADGRTLALRVSPPLRLVRRQLAAGGDGMSQQKGTLPVANTGDAVTATAVVSDNPLADGATTQLTEAAASGATDVNGRSGDAVAVPVCGSFTLPEAEGETVWLLSADRLFAQLEAEVRHG